MQRNPIGNTPLKLPLTPERKELMHRVMDGQPDLAGIMHMLHHYKYCDEILSWLVEHNYTGKNLVDWVLNKFRKSVPDMVAYVVFKHNKKLSTNRMG